MSLAAGLRRPALIVNPSRVRDIGRLQERCARAAAMHGWAAPLLLTTVAADGGGSAARDALAAGADLVIAAGGDGTVRACAQVLAQAGTGVPLAIVAAGCANLTARALDIPTHLGPALAVAFLGQERLIDLLAADGTLAAAMVGIGLDAAVVSAAPAAVKRLAGWPAYAAAGVGQLLRRATTFSIRLDDGAPVVRMAMSVTVGNSGSLPGGFPIMPDARVDDGALDVVVLAPSGLVGWAAVGCRVLVRSRRDDAQLERYRARHVDVHADAELPRQADGEVLPPGDSLSVTIRPGALSVRVPRR